LQFFYVLSEIKKPGFSTELLTRGNYD